MHVNPVVENVLGTIGTVCWSGQLLPQIWKSWRAKSTTGLSPLLVLLWGLAALPLGVYTILQQLSIPLICQPQLFGSLALFSWGQCLYYDMGKSRLAATLIAGSVMLIVGGLEAGMVFAVRPSMNQRAIDFFGIFTSVMIAAGLVPQYYEIFKRREVVGISILFITIDWLGGIFSLLSLLFRPEFDIVAGVAYSLVIVMDGIIIVAAMILNPLARKRRMSEFEEDPDISPQVSRISPATSVRTSVLIDPIPPGAV